MEVMERLSRIYALVLSGRLVFITLVSRIITLVTYALLHMSKNSSILIFYARVRWPRRTGNRRREKGRRLPHQSEGLNVERAKTGPTGRLNLAI